MQYVKEKLCTVRGILSKLRYYAPISVLRTLYFGIAYPHLHYGITSWGNSASKYITKVQVQQNFILKIMTKTSFFKTRLSPIYRQLNFLNLTSIFELEVIKFVYKFKNKTLPTCSTITSGALPKHTATQLDLLWILTGL